MRLVLLAMAFFAGLLPAATVACEALPVGPMVMSNYRHSRFPSPDIPIGERVDDDYFSGAVLVGDSVAEGLGIHGFIPELDVMTVIGISPRTAATDLLFTAEGQPATLVQKLTAMQPTMIYLWLGSNGVDTKDAQRVIDDYDRLLNMLLAALPDVPVYLIELTPVKRIVTERYANYTNERVDAFNALLLGAAKRHNVYLLPINFLFKNADGLLDGLYGAGDGIHLRKDAYEILSDYMYTHTVPMEGDVP